MRIAFGGILHESNTFSNALMTLSKFRESGLKRGSEMIAHWQGTNSEFGGVIAAARDLAIEATPTLGTWGMPAGPVEDEAFEILTRELIERIVDVPDLDGIVLSLHGAMVTESEENADALLLQRVRDAVGRNIPIVLTVDYHANLSQSLVDLAEAVVGYNTYPHVDFAERGREAVEILQRILKGEITPVQALSKPPIIPSIMRQGTSGHPMGTLMKAAFEEEKLPGVVNVTVCVGFPYADVYDVGMGIVAVTDSRPDVARRIASDLEALALSFIDDFQVSLPKPREAVLQALAAAEGPVMLADVGDNVGGGTPGDGTILLTELLDARARDALVLLADPEAVATCMNAGVRARVTLPVGGKTDRWHGAPVTVTGIVRTLSDGIFVNEGPMRDGITEDQGRTAVLQCEGIALVLTELKMPMWNLQQLRALGIEPGSLKIIVSKSAIAFRAAYEPIARQIIEVDTPGLTAADISIYPYRRIRRPIFPLDKEVGTRRNTAADGQAPKR